MLIPKKNRVAIYEHLFCDGVMVAKKDFNAPKHPDVPSVPNLQVIKALQSLRSRGYVTEKFAWRHYYWYLTNDGIQYLRDFLHLPPEIVPSTLKRQVRPEAGRARPSGAPGGKFDDQRRMGSGRGGGEDRDSYRRGGAPGGEEKKGGAGPGFNPQFRGGYGRGGPGTSGQQ
ncbi:small ribosomal subunit protein eS10-like [Oscarella lobularis]|uniref:small ribosomal subunit protein eS10-like n=1 Tax=Oscarella lobularis TaxID=121494 RepID=UPI00331447C0